ncbi:hypothetical protein P152DRAFT_451761 [Eremomyces bilateralis CBS 781.70]|uniref:ATP-dependent DNA helicase n=1 Tax=Eremomyces bilateralis CBS 781.70 TaxID=1392243 RepID=A0A6G1FVX0_9PEZI|nr:uncharacterized protein P152DRAFT_451761 [Eremomyces bilateralis CBS 781.70]KAF1809821.1 hypothetical protein P152DRAFT_451761 [Eremomyces bilateralis CBS 781.70]
MSGETDPFADAADLEDRGDDRSEGPRTTYRSDRLGNATRLIDVLRNAIEAYQVTAGSTEISRMVDQMSRFQQTALDSIDELGATTTLDQGPGTLSGQGDGFPGPAASVVPAQGLLKSIKAQQKSVSRERERIIQGIQGSVGESNAEFRAPNGFGEQDVHFTAADEEGRGGDPGPSMNIQLGPSTSFSAAGKQLAEESFTLNRKQSIALRLICRQLDRIRRDESGVPQLCQFIGGEGGTGKSRIIGAVAALFARKGIPQRLLITATSGTAAANINGVTIHSACGFWKDTARSAGRSADLERFAPRSSTNLRIDGRSRTEWQEKLLLIIDE